MPSRTDGLFFGVGSAVECEEISIGECRNMSSRLPVFRISAQPLSGDTVDEMALGLFGLEAGSVFLRHRQAAFRVIFDCLLAAIDGLPSSHLPFLNSESRRMGRCDVGWRRGQQRRIDRRVSCGRRRLHRAATGDDLRQSSLRRR